MPTFTFRIQTKSKTVTFHFIPVLQEFIKLLCYEGLWLQEEEWVLHTILINLANGKQA